ncbi:uncharacterized protein LOC143433478 [Xylocopa sonorina]|uniref:uncharacterized protein LOC143433478 n=1 Tax=Xylocopa sonorina TaxID=1818115 RepID=UPI00403AC9E2
MDTISRNAKKQDNVVKVKDVLLLNERVFSICDAWPLTRSYANFVIFVSYFTFHMACVYMDLFDALGNLEAMVDNIIDNTVGTATYFILFLFRFNKLIRRAIIIVKQEIAESRFENAEEMRLYFAYHNISDKFGRYAVRIAAVTAVLWYCTPILHLLKPTSGGDNRTSKAYVLPFRMHTFFNYEDDFKNFIIMYLYQSPLVFVALCHISAVSLLLSLVLHVCGKFSILSYRIQNILTRSDINLNKEIKSFVIAHTKLMVTTNFINSALQIFLLIELLQTSIRMAVLIYMILLNPTKNLVSTLTYGLYILIVTSILYLYSFMGERLSYESSKINEAYYDTDWHNLSAHNQKLLLLVMSFGRQTLYITAGKFYTFSLNGFIDDDAVIVNDVFLVHERIFSVTGAWPLRKSYIHFTLYSLYIFVHIIMMYMDLFDVLGDLNGMVDNVMDNTAITTTFFMFFLLRFNKLIKQAITIIKQEIADIKFENVEEMRLYFAYHNISDRFSRYVIAASFVVVFLIYLLPLIQLINHNSNESNETSKVYELPSRAYDLIGYQHNLHIFIAMYLYQLPLVHVGFSHTVAVSMILSMVLHVCGKFSILSYRIQNIPVKSNVDLNSRIKELVIAHIKLLTTTNLINSALQIFLLADLSQTVIRLGVVMYVILVNVTGNFMGNLTYCLYILVVVLILYLYSFIGERLMYESSKVTEAYYDTDWHNLSARNKKLLLLVMCAGRQPMHFTAGKFYTFSLNGFIGVIKTAFGYVSLLRTVVT